MQDFYAGNQNNNYQVLMDINAAMGSHDYPTAQSINNGLATDNTIEAYQKRLNQLLLKYLSYRSGTTDTTNSLSAPVFNNPAVLDATELNELNMIAGSCLDQYGNVVTQARVLLNNVSNRVIDFADNCNPQYNQRKANVSGTIDNSPAIKTQLYPNPNKGSMTLDYELNENSTGEMRIFDINGKLVSVYNLQQAGKLEINQQNLTNGVYYFSIISNGSIIKTDKIIIIK